MPRKSREISQNGIYYAYAFSEKLLLLTPNEEDKKELIAIIHASKEMFDYDLYAYCVTNKEIHLALKEKSTLDISNIMKFILSTYTNYYKKKYELKGSLIYDRFVSMPIENEEKLKSIVRHIHQMPAKEGEYPNVFSYKYSSYADYFSLNNYIEYQYVLNIFSEDIKKGLTSFKIYHAMFDKQRYKKTKRVQLSHKEICQVLESVAKITEEELLKCPKEERLKIAKNLRKKSKLSLRQIAEVCHISRTLIGQKEESLHL